MPLPGRCTAPGLVLILALARGDQVTGVRDGVNGTGRISDELTGPRNVAEFPPCVTDHDCGEEDGYKCFQYMCYPWNRPGKRGAFRSCKRRSDCGALTREEGGDGSPGDCYRHFDRRSVLSGICLQKREMKGCFEHKDCGNSQSGPELQCVNQVCGDPRYLKGIRELGCEKDNFCEDLLLGSHCCFDISGGLEGWYTGAPDWGKKCCSSSLSPVIPPSSNITGEQIDKLSRRISASFSKLGLDQMICQSLDYSLMLKVEACTRYSTTTTTSTTTPKPRPTLKSAPPPRQTSGGLSILPFTLSSLLLPSTFSFLLLPSTFSFLLPSSLSFLLLILALATS